MASGWADVRCWGRRLCSYPDSLCLPQASPQLQDSRPVLVVGACVTLATVTQGAAFGGFLEPWLFLPRPYSSRLLGRSLSWMGPRPSWSMLSGTGTWLGRPARGVRGRPAVHHPLCSCLDPPSGPSLSDLARTWFLFEFLLVVRASLGRGPLTAPSPRPGPKDPIGWWGAGA